MRETQLKYLHDAATAHELEEQSTSARLHGCSLPDAPDIRDSMLSKSMAPLFLARSHSQSSRGRPAGVPRVRS